MLTVWPCWSLCSCHCWGIGHCFTHQLQAVADRSLHVSQALAGSAPRVLCVAARQTVVHDAMNWARVRAHAHAACGSRWPENLRPLTTLRMLMLCCAVQGIQPASQSSAHYASRIAQLLCSAAMTYGQMGRVQRCGGGGGYKTLPHTASGPQQQPQLLRSIPPEVALLQQLSHSLS
jgi:hypothetical protein